MAGDRYLLSGRLAAVWAGEGAGLAAEPTAGTTSIPTMKAALIAQRMTRLLLGFIHNQCDVGDLRQT